MSFEVTLTQAVTTSNATLGSAVPAGQVWKVVAVNLQHAAAGVAKNVALAVGTTATAANIKKRYNMEAAKSPPTDYPNIVMVATEQLNIVTDAGTSEAIMTVTIRKELIA
jgi:hypothetical protein